MRARLNLDQTGGTNPVSQSQRVDGDPNVGVPTGRRRLHRPRVRSSVLVAWMKMLLPATALVLIALVILWPQLLPQDGLLGGAKVTVSDVDTSRMANPRFVGVDEQNRPYEIIAVEALQQGGENDIVLLESPQGDVTLEDDTWLSLSAANGVWHRTEEIVDLSGGVELFQDEGHHLSSDTAHVDIPNCSVGSDSPTVGHGPSGMVEGEGFRLRDRGARIEFTGKAKAVLTGAATGG